MKNYIHRYDEFYPPYLAEKFDVPLSKVLDTIIESWDSFENPHVVGNMIHTRYDNIKWYYEVTDTIYKRGGYIETSDLTEYIKSNQKVDQHYSVFAHCPKWLKNLKRTQKVSCENTLLKVPILWIEMDRKDYDKVADKTKAIEDAFKLKDKFKEHNDSVRVYFSGNASTHVAINGSLFGNPIIPQHQTRVVRELVKLLVGDIRHSNGISDPYSLNDSELDKLYPDYPDKQKLLASLENFDPNIYRTNSLIRLPLSYHEKTGGQKKSLGGTCHKSLPYLLHLWYEAYENISKIPPKPLDVHLDSSYIIEGYKEHYPDITNHKPNAQGWIGRFHNIFYDDGNPDVLINIHTGYYKDFGSRRYSMDFEQFLKKAQHV